MKKILFSLIVALTLLFSLSAVCADENVTGDLLSESDVVADDIESSDTVQYKANSTIAADDAVGYDAFKTKLVVNLTSNGTSLSSRQIAITVNDVTYNKTTNANGQASLKVKLPAGKYDVKYFYAGDENTTQASFTSKLTVKPAIKTTIKVADKNINYRQGLTSLFIVHLADANGKALSNQDVIIKVNGKEYNIKTDANGDAQITLSLKKGKYKAKFYFKSNSPYLASKDKFKIVVKPKMAKGDGYWIFGADMKKVNLKSLSKSGTKQIFLNFYSIKLYGKSGVASWIKKANKYGISVHIWMQVFYSGGKWVVPIDDNDGSIKYSYITSKVKEAKSYAKIKGVAGIHFDYVRLSGVKYRENGYKAVNYFVEKATAGIHKVNPNCIVSAAVMPEPSSLKYYYGQDIPTITKYVDAIVPMAYKGNYGQKTSWITSVTKTLVKQSKGAKVWCGLQTYKSDDDPTKLSSKKLLKDAKAAKSGGASGVILFRFGLVKYINFKKV